MVGWLPKALASLQGGGGVPSAAAGAEPAPAPVAVEAAPAASPDAAADVLAWCPTWAENRASSRTGILRRGGLSTRGSRIEAALLTLESGASR